MSPFYSHLLHHLKLQFISEFRKLSPSVSGVQEALDRLRTTESGSWGTTVQFDANFKNMYSNCNVQLLKNFIKICAGYAGLSEASIYYINNLVDVNMTHSYFHEPTGIFHTASGFSMGDHSASRGSEVILRTSELRTYRALSVHSFLHKVLQYFRFKDDINGTKEENLEIIEIITTTYPKDIQVNVDIGLIHGKFLNLRIYNLINSSISYTMILRKRNSKYDIILKYSNTCTKYKSCAAKTYFDMTWTHCSDQREQRQQEVILPSSHQATKEDAASKTSQRDTVHRKGGT